MPYVVEEKITSSLSNKATMRIAVSLDKSLDDLDESIRALNAQKLEARLSNLPEKINSLFPPPRQLAWVSQTFNSILTMSSPLQFSSSDKAYIQI